MRTPSKFAACLVAAAAALATLPAAAQDADSQEVTRYTLTDAGLAKYTKASQNLAALPGGSPGCAQDDDSDSESNSISELAAKIDVEPMQICRRALASLPRADVDELFRILGMLQQRVREAVTARPIVRASNGDRSHEA